MNYSTYTTIFLIFFLRRIARRDEIVPTLHNVSSLSGRIFTRFSPQTYMRHSLNCNLLIIPYLPVEDNTEHRQKLRDDSKARRIQCKAYAGSRTILDRKLSSRVSHFAVTLPCCGTDDLAYKFVPQHVRFSFCATPESIMVYAQ